MVVSDSYNICNILSMDVQLDAWISLSVCVLCFHAWFLKESIPSIRYECILPFFFLPIAFIPYSQVSPKLQSCFPFSWFLPSTQHPHRTLGSFWNSLFSGLPSKLLFRGRNRRPVFELGEARIQNEKVLLWE